MLEKVKDLQILHRLCLELLRGPMKQWQNLGFLPGKALSAALAMPLRLELEVFLEVHDSSTQR